MYSADKVKETLTIEQIFDIIEHIGGNPTQHGDYLKIDTICHNHAGEGSHKLYYYDNTKLFRCYTGCADYFDIFQLIIKAFEIQQGKEISLPQAVGEVVGFFGLTGVEENGFFDSETKDWEIFRRAETREVRGSTRELFTISDKILTAFPTPRITPWIKEGISQETIDRYEIKYYPANCQIVIPHRNKDGELVGIRGRTLVQEDAERYGKYMPLRVSGQLFNHPIGAYLYGLHLNKKPIQLAKTAIVFESEKSVMMYDSLFGSESNISCACCGSSISAFQIEELISLGVEEVVIAFDKQFKEIGDEEHKQQIRNIRRIADKFNSRLSISCVFDKYGDQLGYRQAPIERGAEVFQNMLINRIYL